MIWQAKIGQEEINVRNTVKYEVWASFSCAPRPLGPPHPLILGVMECVAPDRLHLGRVLRAGNQLRDLVFEESRNPERLGLGEDDRVKGYVGTDHCEVPPPDDLRIAGQHEPIQPIRRGEGCRFDRRGDSVCKLRIFWSKGHRYLSDWLRA